MLLISIMSPVVGSDIETLSFNEKHIYINDFKHYIENVNIHNYQIIIGILGAIT